MSHFDKNFKNSSNRPSFGIFNELLSTQNINIARFARSVKWDFLKWFSNTVPWNGDLLYELGSNHDFASHGGWHWCWHRIWQGSIRAVHRHMSIWVGCESVETNVWTIRKSTSCQCIRELGRSHVREIVPFGNTKENIVKNGKRNSYRILA